VQPRIVYSTFLGCTGRGGGGRPSAAPCCAGWKDDIGFNQLQSRLGPAMPTGADIKVAQIETSVGVGVNYLPDRTDAQFVCKSINPLSGSAGVSCHATTVGNTILV